MHARYCHFHFINEKPNSRKFSKFAQAHMARITLTGKKNKIKKHNNKTPTFDNSFPVALVRYYYFTYILVKY